MNQLRPSATELYYMDQIVLATREDRAIENGIREAQDALNIKIEGPQRFDSSEERKPSSN